jgi:hypothetical protein
MNRGSLTGTITDKTGGVIPRVEITIRNTATGALHQTVANTSGQYTMPSLPPGPYEMEFTAAGFKKLLRRGIDVAATDVVRVDAILEIGQVSESISVTAEAPRIQSETHEVSTSVSSRQLSDLPLSFAAARDPEAFAFKISPAVMGGTYESHIGGSISFSKEVLVDGASITTTMAGDMTTGPISTDSIAEFKIVTSGMNAEFGRSQGGVFNFIMKSGANEIHGSLYGSIRNEALNANTFANKFRGIPRALDRKQDGAAGFGAPVYLPKVYNGRNRTFFYTTYERYRERSFGFGSPSTTVPVPEFYEGDFSRLLQGVAAGKDALGRTVNRGSIFDPATFTKLPTGRWIADMFPGNVVPKSRFSEVSKRVNALASKWNAPLVRDPDGRWALQKNAYFPQSNAPVFDNHQFSTKVDQNFSDRHKLAGSASYVIKDRSTLTDTGGIWSLLAADGGPLSAAHGQRLESQYERLTEDWTLTPTTLNHFSVFYNRMHKIEAGKQAGVDGAAALGIKGLSTYGYPAINWGGGPYVSQTAIGYTVYSGNAYTGWGFSDSVSFHKGSHFMKAGFEFRGSMLNTRPTQGGSFTFAARGTAIPNESFSGSQTGYAFASYLLGIVDVAGLTEPSPMGGRRHYYAAFLQDDFKVNKRLTLQVGVRWEYQPPAFEAADRYASWTPDVTDPISGLPGAYAFAGKCGGCTGKRYFGTPSLRDWGPRIGFAYRFAEKTTIRGGYGIMYAPDLFNSQTPTPLAKATNPQVGGTWLLNADPIQPWFGIFNWDNGFPTDRYQPATRDLSWGNRTRPGRVDPNYGRTPYVQEWNLNIQRELPKKIVLDVGYAANKSTGLYNNALSATNQLPSSVLANYGTRLGNPVRNPADAAANGIRYPFPGFSGTVASALRDYPQVQGNSTINDYAATLGFSNYQSLQITVNRQVAKGLTAYGNYVWSKNLSNTSSARQSDNNAPMDYYNLRIEKALVEYDIPHAVKAYAQYELPLGRGKTIWSGAGRLVDGIAGGWSLNIIANYYSGAPLGFGGASSPVPNGWNGAQRTNVAPGKLRKSGFDSSKFDLADRLNPANTYLNTSLISDPEPFTLGTAALRYGQLRGFGTIDESFGLQKNMRFREKYRFQLRADVLNAFNRHALGGIDTNIKSPAFGQVTGVSGSRNIQLGARLDF